MHELLPFYGLALHFYVLYVIPRIQHSLALSVFTLDTPTSYKYLPNDKISVLIMHSNLWWNSQIMHVTQPQPNNTGPFLILQNNLRTYSPSSHHHLCLLLIPSASHSPITNRSTFEASPTQPCQHSLSTHPPTLLTLIVLLHLTSER